MLFFLLLLSKCISAELSGHSNMAEIKVPLIKSCGWLFYRKTTLQLVSRGLARFHSILGYLDWGLSLLKQNVKFGLVWPYKFDSFDFMNFLCILFIMILKSIQQKPGFLKFTLFLEDIIFLSMKMNPNLQKYFAAYLIFC